MTDKGVLTLDERADLSGLVAVADGYSSVERGGRRLYPHKTEAGQLYFSRARAPSPVLVDWKTNPAA